jgi:hypothetical protein
VGDRCPEVGEQLGVAPVLGDLVVAVAHLLERQAVGHSTVRERDRGRPQVARPAVHDLVDEPALDRLRRVDVAARRHHLERLRHADQTREPLRTSGAGQQAEVDLGEPELRGRERDAVVGAQRDLEAAAERGPVDRSDHRDGTVLHRCLGVGQARPARLAAELADVGAGDERPALADQHDRRRAAVDGLRHALGEPLAHVPAQRVHGRVVDHDHGDVAVPFEANRFGQLRHAASQSGRSRADSVATADMTTPDHTR